MKTTEMKLHLTDTRITIVPNSNGCVELAGPEGVLTLTSLLAKKFSDSYPDYFTDRIGVAWKKPVIDLAVTISPKHETKETMAEAFAGAT